MMAIYQLNEKIMMICKFFHSIEKVIDQQLLKNFCFQKFLALFMVGFIMVTKNHKPQQTRNCFFNAPVITAIILQMLQQSDAILFQPTVAILGINHTTVVLLWFNVSAWSTHVLVGLHFSLASVFFHLFFEFMVINN